MVRLNWTSQAVYDLKDIFDYIAKDSKRYAKLQIDRIKNHTQILKEYPKSGKIVTELNAEDIREIIEGNYRIIHRIVSPEQIDILTVHHVAMNLRKERLID